jgi:bifunctional pyridoxal-dependent enzyme with beta-cystathionase and maltose regulon repressor activities
MAEAVRALALNELRKRKSSKWRDFPSDVLPLPVAEMDFPIAEPIKSALIDMIERSDISDRFQKCLRRSEILRKIYGIGMSMSHK